MGTDKRKLIAWGASPLFELYLRYAKGEKPAYCIDANPARHGTKLFEVEIFPPAVLDKEKPEELLIINFALSSEALQSINNALTSRGYVLGKNYLDFAAFLQPAFQPRAEKALGAKFDINLLSYARAFNISSTVPLETTVLGNWLLLEALRATTHLDGAIAEIGAFKCGNSMLLLNALSVRSDKREYFILDSFQGFGELSPEDPQTRAKDYAYDYKLPEILNRMSLYKQAHVIPGFVPNTFSQLPQKQKYSVVFFDCDLYQPALDTYDYFWDRILPGGFLIIHDNISAESGWKGVRTATDKFFTPLKVPVIDLWETTMSIVQKPI